MSYSYNSGIIRAIRGLLDIEQGAMAKGCELSIRTYIEAERGRGCTQTSWNKIIGYAERNGIALYALPGGIGIYVTDERLAGIAAIDRERTKQKNEAINAPKKTRVLPSDQQNR